MRLRLLPVAEPRHRVVVTVYGVLAADVRAGSAPLPVGLPAPLGMGCCRAPAMITEDGTGRLAAKQAGNAKNAKGRG